LGTGTGTVTIKGDTNVTAAFNLLGLL
jgi:hypothetical protein